MEAEENTERKAQEKQEVWSWGAGTDGQLGTGKLQDEHLPQLLPSLSAGEPISTLSCGGAHVLALLSNGKVLTWGRGTSGQLGHGDMLNCLQPKSVEFLDSLIITHLSAGWNHSGFVSDDGCLFTCGDGSFGQLGHSDSKSQCCPVKVSYFVSRHVEKIACGMRHSLALLKGRPGDQVYGFGFAKRGQLGISTNTIRSISLPQATNRLEDVNVVSIIANGDHSAALSVDGHLYIWGRGFSRSSDAYYPYCAIASLSLTQAALGWNHALVLTGDGKAFTFGGENHGVLCDPHRINMVKNPCWNSEEPNEVLTERVPGLDDIKVVQVAAGAEHSALVTEDGAIMIWGWAEHGQLGLGNTYDQTMPQFVCLSQNVAEKNIPSKVYCGSGFTFAVRAHGPASQL